MNIVRLQLRCTKHLSNAGAKVEFHYSTEKKCSVELSVEHLKNRLKPQCLSGKEKIKKKFHRRSVERQWNSPVELLYKIQCAT